MKVYAKSGWWVCDLRGVGGRRLALGLPASVPQARAERAAAELLKKLTLEAGQTSFNLESPRTVAEVLERWIAVEVFPTTDTRKHYEKHARALGVLCGARAAATLFGKDARAAWEAVAQDFRAAPTKTKTNHHRWMVLKRAARWSCDRGWGWGLSDLPAGFDLPSGRRASRARTFPSILRDGEERLYVPRTRFIRAEELWQVIRSPAFVRATREHAEHETERGKWTRILWARQTWLLMTYFCAARPKTASTATWGRFSGERPRWFNIHSKTRKTHRPAWVDLPLAMWGWLQEERTARAAEHNQVGEDELVAGPWPHYSEALRAAAKALGWQPFTVNDVRRGFATECARSGMSRRATSFYFGHSSSAMLENVYEQVMPEELESVRNIGAEAPPPPVAGEADVIELRPRPRKVVTHAEPF